MNYALPVALDKGGDFGAIWDFDHTKAEVNVVTISQEEQQKLVNMYNCQFSRPVLDTRSASWIS